jgi:malate dehydrogenase (oxaloacetate-decarboxylating)(NADP+)
MSSVDLTKIEQQIKMAALDQHRGYVQDHYQEVKQERTPEYVDETNAAGYQIVREPLWNKGKSINSTSSLQQHSLSTRETNGLS